MLLSSRKLLHLLPPLSSFASQEDSLKWFPRRRQVSIGGLLNSKRRFFAYCLMWNFRWKQELQKLPNASWIQAQVGVCWALCSTFLAALLSPPLLQTPSPPLLPPDFASGAPPQWHECLRQSLPVGRSDLSWPIERCEAISCSSRQSPPNGSPPSPSGFTWLRLWTWCCRRSKPRLYSSTISLSLSVSPAPSSLKELLGLQFSAL